VTTTELEVNGRSLTCNIKYKRIRHAYLRISPSFHLEISLPTNRSITAESILEEKRRWIEKKVRELSRLKKIFLNGTILYHGEYLNVEFRLAEKEYAGVELGKKAIIVYGNLEQKSDKLLADFITLQTLGYVRHKAEEFAPELGVRYSSISTKKTKSWGCCTRQGSLFFNWRLICLPLSLVDFIVFHELLHLKHFNHSSRFKNAMAKQFANHKELEAGLKTYMAN
jgi:predicted metal-dependent hydrolase